MQITIVELPEFIKKSDKLLSDGERNKLVYYLSLHPKSGIILEGTRGLRKLRWASKGKGKSGGLRIIYFYHNNHIPLFLLTLFAKGEKANANKAERNELAKLANILISNYERKK